MLLSADRAVLLLVDLQQRLMPAIHDSETVLVRAGRLAEAALLLDVPVVATEQYPVPRGAEAAEMTETGGRLHDLLRILPPGVGARASARY